MKNSATKKSGFGLIEVMISIVIMITVIGAAGALTSQSLATALSAQESLIASGLAQELIEQARLSRDQNPNGPIQFDYATKVVLNNITYERVVTISDKEDNSLYRNLYWDVLASVTWNNARNNQEKQYSLNSILTQWQ